jgi:competence protein ComEC
VLRKVRGPIAIAMAVALVAVLLGGGARAPEAGVVAFDVGQGDALLLSGGEGRFVLVDGGPEPAVLLENLAEYRVRRLELVVLTHVHADHAAGLVGLVGRVPIEHFWAVTEPHETPASKELLGRLTELGIAVETPDPGDRYELGSLDLTVLGPLRRYASPNDQSIVMMVEGPARSMLLTGDVEAIAQADLRALRSDVLKVPHQGAATSDLGWLADVNAELAVISVGDNDFGHPDPGVISALEESGAKVARTDVDGDVIVDLG